MNLLKKVKRNIIVPILFGCKFDVLFRMFSKPSDLHVMYHGVVSKDLTNFSVTHICKKQFEKHLLYFKKHFEIVTVKEQFHSVNTSGKKRISISFDDGYKNNLIEALPLLEKYEIPVTIFVSGICADDSNELLWMSYIMTLKHFYPGQKITLGKYNFVNFWDEQYKISIQNVIKQASYDEREMYLNTLISRYDLEEKLKEIPRELWELLTSDDIIELNKSKWVEIGSHGYSHYNLGVINSEYSRLELEKSKILLENILNSKVSMIAYPDGSYNESVKDISDSLGYKEQFAVTYKNIDDVKDERIISRFGVSNTTTFESNMLALNMAFNKKGF